MNRNKASFVPVAVLATLGAAAAMGQALPNPYRLVDGWAKLPGGREIGAACGQLAERSPLLPFALDTVPTIG